jgi:hypothetical protein
MGKIRGLVNRLNNNVVKLIGEIFIYCKRL